MEWRTLFNERFANDIGLEFPPLNFSVVSKLDYSSPTILNIVLDYMLYGMLNTVRTESIKCININMKKTNKNSLDRKIY